MDNSEFIISKLEAAIASAKSYDLGTTLITGILGLLTVILALGTILPASLPLRLLLVVATVAAVLFSYWEIRRLIRNRNQRLKMLREWSEEVFFARTKVDLLDQGKIRKILDLIQSIEDAHMPPSSNSWYEEINDEFMSMLKNDAPHS